MAPLGTSSLQPSWLRLSGSCTRGELHEEDEEEDREAHVHLLHEVGPCGMLAGGATRGAAFGSWSCESARHTEHDGSIDAEDLGIYRDLPNCDLNGSNNNSSSSSRSYNNSNAANRATASSNRHHHQHSGGLREGFPRVVKASFALLAVAAVVISTLLVTTTGRHNLAGDNGSPPSLDASRQQFQSLAALHQQPRFCGSGGRSEPKGGGVVNLVGAMLPPAPFTLTVHVRSAQRGDSGNGLENILAWSGLGDEKSEDCAALALTESGHLQWREKGHKIVEANGLNLRDGAWHRVAVTRQVSGEVNLIADDMILAGDRANSKSSKARCGFVAQSGSWKSDRETFDGDIGTLRVFASSLSLGDIDGAFGPCYSADSLDDLTTTSTRTRTMTTTTTVPTTTTVTTTTLLPTTTTHAKAPPAPSAPSPSLPAPSNLEPWQSWLPSGDTNPTFPPAQVGCFGRSSFDDIDSICEGLPEKNCEMLSNCRWSNR
mmetsp:Transcript_82595/g.172877  ORF Transcript_82595/g.172877 Transcript_82595/m.172877 type:complete len:487 (-) Transcript_82595:78-1538(-)